MLSSCVTSSVLVNVHRPADITINKDIQNIVVVNRAAFNMALASEIKGSLKTAIDWAKKAQKIGNKKAYNYINVLTSRVMDEEKLKQQLN